MSHNSSYDYDKRRDRDRDERNSRRRRRSRSPDNRRARDRGESDEQVAWQGLPEGSGMAAYAEQSSAAALKYDWFCSNCSVSNFARRAQCFRCGYMRDPSCRLDKPNHDKMGWAADQMEKLQQHAVGGGGNSGGGSGGGGGGGGGVNTLVLRDLAFSTGTGSVWEALSAFGRAVREVRLPEGREPGARNRGFAFVEFSDAQAADHALRRCRAEGLLVDGRTVTVEFANHSRGGGGNSHSSGTDSNRLSSREAKRGDSHDSRYDDEPGFNNGSADSQKRQAEELAAAAAALKAKKKSPFPPTFEEGGAAWVFDAASGYFLEAASGWYYEPKAKMYYGVPAGAEPGAEQKWHMHCPGHDPPFQVYDPPAEGQQQQPAAAAAADQAPTTEGAAQPAAAAVAETAAPAAAEQPAAAAAAAEPEQPQQRSEGREAAKKRKKLDKEAREAKRKRQEEALRAPVIKMKMTHVLTAAPAAAAAAPAAAPEPAAAAAPAAAPAAAAPAKAKGGGGRGKPGAMIATKCELCKRGFASVDQLRKHETKSKLHKDNVAKAVAEGRPVPPTVAEKEAEAAAYALPPEEPQAAVPAFRLTANAGAAAANARPAAPTPAPAPAPAAAPSEQPATAAAAADQRPAAPPGEGGGGGGPGAAVAEVLQMDALPQYVDRAALRRATQAPPPDAAPAAAAPDPYAHVEVAPPTEEERRLYLADEGAPAFAQSSAVPLHHQQANVGAQMLQRMGWQDGRGLGRGGAGMVNPVQADASFEKRMGIGGQGQGLDYAQGGSYRETLYSMSKARFDAADANANWR